ncbi:MAG: AraC family transcriptional regulator [Longicatena sp.]
MENNYNVLIVEKQKQMIHVYKNMLPWEDYGFHISSVTDNEDQALSYYGEYKHDLVFTSIDLNLGNGISLIKQIRYLNSNCHIIVISSHDDYNSVHDAFVAGCNDYFLKSKIKHSELARILNLTKEQLNKELSTDEYNSLKLENLLGLFRDKQKIDPSSIIEILRKEDISVLKGKYQVMYFRMDNVRIFNRTMQQYEKPLWLSTDEFINMFQNKLLLRDEMQIKLKEIIEDYFVKIPLMYLVFTKKHSGLIILPQLENDDVVSLARNLICEIRNILTYEYSITISNLTEGLDSFLPTYEQVLNYHSNKFYDGDSCVQIVLENKKFSSIESYVLNNKEQIVNALDAQCYDLVFELCKKTIIYMKDNRIDPEQVKAYFANLLDKIKEMINGKGIIETFHFDALRKGIEECESISFLEFELTHILRLLIDWMKENNVSRYKTQVSEIIKFIYQHLHQKISLAMIADAIGLSEIHVGRIFKKETGKSIVEFINEVKMKKAVELLEKDKLKIKDIAAQVGIGDQLYFNKVFKKYYQLSPRDYRKKHFK